MMGLMQEGASQSKVVLIVVFLFGPGRRRGRGKAEKGWVTKRQDGEETRAGTLAAGMISIM